MSIIDFTTAVEDPDDVADEVIEDEGSLTAETLLEEISIDGMCGVY
ncbi:mycofactocin precursor MftA [Kribbella sp. NPDC050124]